MLNELDKSYLQRVAEEDGMIGAIRKYFKDQFVSELPTGENSTDDDVVYGIRVQDLAGIKYTLVRG